jgi:hypothetical protein
MYHRVLAVEPTGFLAGLLREPGERLDAIGELRRLTPVLKAANARLLFLVEDADRTGSDFDPQHLQRLLWALRSVPGVSFILAVDPKRAQFDSSKVCDHIEAIPRLDADDVRRVLRLVRDHCLSDFDFIDPLGDRAEKDRLDLKEADSELEAYARRRYRISVSDRLTELLVTPRQLKHVVRRVDRAWSRLYGEIDLDDVIVAIALREGSPAAFDFLLRDVDGVRDKEHEWPEPPTALQEAWRALLTELPEGNAAQKLVDFLALEAIADPNREVKPQGLQNEEPADYFRRLLAEEVPAGEIRDQEVLRDIRAWLDKSKQQLVDRLVAAEEHRRGYVRTWEHFAFLMSDADLMRLTEDVLRAVKGRDGVQSSIKRPALLALWRRANRRFAREAAAPWLSGIITDALSLSIDLSNELYEYWAS